MAVEQLNELNRMIGALREAVDQMGLQLHRFDALQDEVRSLKYRVDAMSHQISVIEPSITRYNERRLREEGARQYGNVIWGAVLTAAGLTGWAISTFVHWILGKPPL